jgi:hypothetical protein
MLRPARDRPAPRPELHELLVVDVIISMPDASTRVDILILLTGLKRPARQSCSSRTTCRSAIT